MTLNKEEILKRANASCKNTLMETLRIEFTDFGDDYMEARMPVDSRVHQPDGVLHGGATVALAESLGSLAAFVILHKKDVFVRGIEISANHLKSIKSGYVFAKAQFVHIGRTTQLCEIKITDKDNRLISFCKLTTISLPKS